MAFASRMRSGLDVVSTIAIIVAASVLIWTLLDKRLSRPAEQKLVTQVEGLRIDAARARNAIGSGQIAIVEFSDFQCPFCSKHARETFPILMREFIESGMVRYVALHYPLQAVHPLALQASEAAECAARQGRFWDMHQRLFADSRLSDADLLHHAEALGLDRTRFVQCLEREESLENVLVDQAEGERLGVKGTPAFFVGRVRNDGGIDLLIRIAGAAPPEVFAQQIAAITLRSS